jgi:hypothetical protein
MQPPNEAAITRIIALCRSESRNLLSQCNLHLELAEHGFTLALDDGGQGVISKLLHQDHLESLIGASLNLSIETISLIYPNEEPLEIAVKRFAELYEIDEKLVDWAASVDHQATIHEFCRLEQRCRAALHKIPHLTFILDHQGRYLECNDCQDLLAAPWEEVVGKLPEDVLPMKAANQIGDAFLNAKRFQERPHYVSYALSINGIPRRFRAKLIAYGGDKGEAIAIIKDVTLHQNPQVAESRCA